MTNRWAAGWAVTAVARGLLPGQLRAGVFDAKAFGAKGDGKAPGRDAINRAIDAAAAGGGTVNFRPGATVKEAPAHPDTHVDKVDRKEMSGRT